MRRLIQLGAALAALLVPSGAHALRAIPDTTAAVHVWNDQLPDSMSDAQVHFVATHMTRHESWFWHSQGRRVFQSQCGAGI